MAEKKGLIYRLTMGSDNNPDFTTDKLPSNRFQVFKDVMGMRMKTLALLNIFMVAFCLPAVAAYIYFMWLIQNKIGLQTPYSGSLGVGYSAYFYTEMLGNASYFYNYVFFWAVMIPCIMIASIGFAGGFHTIKLLVWGEGVSFFQTFFQGIKNNFAIYLLISFVVGLFLFLTNINLQAHLILGTSWVTIMGSIVSIVTLVFSLFMTMFVTTQAVTYKLGLFALIKNSFILTIAKIFTNILFLALSALPIIILLIFPAVASIVAIFYLVIGISMTILIWTLYTHYVYDLFLNDRIEGAIKDRGIYRKKVERDEAEKAAAKKYANPKKKKKLTSIDEGKSFTPLAASFSRADLERMEAEKEEVKIEIQHELERAEQDDVDEVAADDTDAVEAVEDEAVEVESGDYDVSDLEALEGVSKEALDRLQQEYASGDEKSTK